MNPVGIIFESIKNYKNGAKISNGMNKPIILQLENESQKLNKLNSKHKFCG